MASPVIKWVGGKGKLLPELLARMPTRFGRYYEPFAGGLALYFRVAPIRAVINDGNRDLIGLYQTIATNVDGLARRLEVYRAHHSEAHYYEMRARFNDAGVSWTKIDRAAAFVYLNKTCYNGLWRVNRAGQFNVPIGRYVNPPICVPETLRAASEVLKTADIRHGDFRQAVRDARAGDFVYFDPPYEPLTRTSNFTSYTQGGFSQDDQRELADLARSLVARGCYVMLSNSDTPFIRDIYKGFEVSTVRCARAINSKAGSRGAVNEVVAVGRR